MSHQGLGQRRLDLGGPAGSCSSCRYGQSRRDMLVSLVSVSWEAGLCVACHSIRRSGSIQGVDTESCLNFLKERLLGQPQSWFPSLDFSLSSATHRYLSSVIFISLLNKMRVTEADKGLRLMKTVHPGPGQVLAQSRSSTKRSSLSTSFTSSPSMWFQNKVTPEDTGGQKAGEPGVWGQGTPGQSILVLVRECCFCAGPRWRPQVGRKPATEVSDCLCLNPGFSIYTVETGT